MTNKEKEIKTDTQNKSDYTPPFVMAGDTGSDNGETSAQEKSETVHAAAPSDYYEQMLRLRAEFDNYRKRVEREKSAQRAWAKEEILVKQISLLDIMTQALSAAKSTRNVEGVIVGLEMIIKEFEKMLSEEGVSAVADGGVFDPTIHEAVEAVEDDSSPDGEIKEVVQKGYLMGERLIRPARVKIVKNMKTGNAIG
ncbi:MAG: nucleotide exchange factor GrpE [Endomicrobiia bacterium]|nr:nucleotide exchange factor GrpE [Endomicrobiia bacterium]